MAPPQQRRWVYDLDAIRSGKVKIVAHWQSGVSSVDIEYEQSTQGPREAMALIKRLLTIDTQFQGPDDPQETD